LKALAPAENIRSLSRLNNGWRWWTHEPSEDPLKKKSVRYPMNYFRRQGVLEAKHLRTPDEWDSIKEEFYLQHSMRQVFGGREVSLDNPQKREFFDKLIRSSYGHVTALLWNGHLIAAHVGSVFKDVLYWGAPSFDVRQRQYSPNLVLLALTMHNSAAWGFPTGVDLTMGKGEVKERFSNSRVEVPLVDLYKRPSQFYSRKLRAALSHGARNLYERVAGDGAWEKRFKPAVENVIDKLSQARDLGPAETLRRVFSWTGRLVGERTRGIVFIARPQDAREIQPELKPGEVCTYHDNELYDLLKQNHHNDGTAREIAALAREYSDLQRSGRTLHTLLVNDRLAAWGISYKPQEPAKLTEVGGAILEFAPDSASMYGFYTLPEFRNRRIYGALLTYVLKKHFAGGIAQAYISVLENNAPSRKAIERAGFRAVGTNEFRRFLRWKKLVSRSSV
jgi:RimJ/RimL family protein N-acetyltransferase